MNKERQAIFNLFLAGLLIVCAIVISVVQKDTTTQLQQISAEVTSTQGEIQQLTDTNGNIWEVEDEDLAMYGRYIVTLDNQCTSDITDDTIVKIEQRTSATLICKNVKRKTQFHS